MTATTGYVLHTDRLLLRRWTLDDLDALHVILSDPITMRFWPAPFDRAATRAWIERNLERYAEDGFGRWAMLLRDSGELIGDAGILRSTVAGQAEIDLGYIVHHPFQGHGYASEAAAACLRYALDTLQLPRVVANMPADHHASARVAQKLGLRFERSFNNQRNRDLPTLLYVYEGEHHKVHKES